MEAKEQYSNFLLTILLHCILKRRRKYDKIFDRKHSFLLFLRQIDTSKSRDKNKHVSNLVVNRFIITINMVF